jgi:hypothetical protein
MRAQASEPRGRRYEPARRAGEKRTGGLRGVAPPGEIAGPGEAAPAASRTSRLVGLAGFEPAAPATQTRCATKLRYSP